MIGVTELLIAVSNTRNDTPVFVDVAGNGKAPIPLKSVEVIDGKLVIATEGKAAKVKDDKSAEMIAQLRRELKEAHEVVQLRDGEIEKLNKEIEQLTAPVAPIVGQPATETAASEGGEKIDLA